MVGTAMEKIATALAVIECLGGEALSGRTNVFCQTPGKEESSELMTHVGTIWLFDVVCLYPFLVEHCEDKIGWNWGFVCVQSNPSGCRQNVRKNQQIGM